MRQALVIVGIFLLAVVPSLAQDSVDFSEWRKVCATMDGGLPCVVRRDIKDGDGKVVATTEIKLQEDGSIAPILRVQGPILLPEGLSWGSDRLVELPTLKFFRCLPSLCEALATADSNFVEALKRGRTFTLGATDLKRNKVQHEFSLSGFTKAIEGPPSGTIEPEEAIILPDPMPDAGPWQTQCQEGTCVIRRVISEGEKPLGSVLIRVDADRSNLVVSAPIGVDLRFGLVVKPETGHDEVRVPFVHCSDDVCTTQLGLNEAFLNAMTESASMTLTAAKPDRSEIVLEFPMTGLKEELGKRS